VVVLFGWQGNHRVTLPLPLPLGQFSHPQRVGGWVVLSIWLHTKNTHLDTNQAQRRVAYHQAKLPRLTVVWNDVVELCLTMSRARTVVCLAADWASTLVTFCTSLMQVMMSGGRLANLFQNPVTMGSESYPAKRGILWIAEFCPLCLLNDLWCYYFLWISSNHPFVLQHIIVFEPIMSVNKVINIVIVLVFPGILCS